MKFLMGSYLLVILGRSPYGERGLKFDLQDSRVAHERSLPVWGAWIEIRDIASMEKKDNVAPRMGSVD